MKTASTSLIYQDPENDHFKKQLNPTTGWQKKRITIGDISRLYVKIMWLGQESNYTV